MQQCVCGSGKVFQDCCEPILSGKNQARTIKQLMRSRYSAYALGGYVDYLLSSWHPTTVQDIKSLDLSISALQWLGLEIINFQQKGDVGTVEFKATFCDEGGLQKIHHEKSVFNRLQGQWLYVEGKLF